MWNCSCCECDEQSCADGLVGGCIGCLCVVCFVVLAVITDGTKSTERNQEEIVEKTIVEQPKTYI